MGKRRKFLSGVRAKPQPKTILVLSRRDRTHLAVMSVKLFDKPENVQHDFGGVGSGQIWGWLEFLSR